jgi:cell wall-active antibiotic response 4TMS protein YvqF
VFLAATQGFLNLDWGNIWPVFLMLIGAGGLAQALLTEDRNRRAGMVLGSTIPLLLGAFFFANTTGVLSWSDQGMLWPVYPLILGVAFFAAYFASGREQAGYLVPGTILSLVGVVFLGITLTGTSYDSIGKVWPIFLIIAGVLLLIWPRLARTERHN